ncbi:MAG: SWIM zinc finger family protein [Bacillota bacterium]
MNKKFMIKDFEDYIPEHILSRAYDYYMSETIDNLHIEGDVVYATVLGNHTYDVNIQLDKTHRYVLSTSCTCPYDKGLYCKHIAAVLYQLLDEIPNENIEDLKPFLEGKSKEELIDILLSISHEYPIIASRFKHFDIEDEVEQMIDDYLYDYIEEGFIGYKDLPKAIKGFEAALRKAEIASPIAQFQISFTIIKKWIDIYMETDDSSGYLSSIKDQALFYLNEASRQIEDPSLILENVQGMTEIMLKNMGTDIDDIYIEWMNAIIPLSKHKEIKTILTDVIKVLLNHETEYQSFKYYKDDLMEIYYQILYLSSKEEADALMYENLDNRAMKLKYIEKAFDEKRYDVIIKMCEEDLIKSFRYEEEWHHWLVQAYQLNQQTDLALKHMRALILKGDTTYYQAYKTSYDDESWKDETLNLLEILGREKYPRPMYEKIMIEEKMYNQLFVYIKKHSHKVFEFYRYLNNEYQEEVKSLMEQEIYEQFLKGSSKKQYLYRVSYLDTYKNAYGKEETKILASNLKSHFKNRKALNEVLDLYVKKI